MTQRQMIKVLTLLLLRIHCINALGLGINNQNTHTPNSKAPTETTTPPDSTTARVLARQIETSTTLYSSVYGNSMADSDVEWDEYQQAWRYLGFMIDCEDDSHWDDDRVSGSYDADTFSANGCRRYVLWAAYVDPYYEGGGIAEYQYWDKDKQKWNTNPCNYNQKDNGRCAKMDCHSEDTHWSLLGIFKHRQPDDWMEQLFKHEGVCVWTDQEYAFMKRARKAWPKGCFKTGSTTLSGRAIYHAIKAAKGGSIAMGLYTDDKCIEEYTGANANVQDIVGNFLVEQEASHDSGDDDSTSFYKDFSFKQALEYWDYAMDSFRTCQPCIAHDLNNVGYNGGEQGSSFGTYDCGSGDKDNYNDGNDGCVKDDFDCYDDAGYTNVNQCMKFRAKTHMDPATLRDVMLAHKQGTLVESLPLAGMQEPSAGFFKTMLHMFWSVLYFGVAGYFFLSAITYFVKAREHVEWPSFVLKQPLV